MNAHFFILALMYEAVAFVEHDEYYDIGTVLFSPSDMRKICWSTAEVGLLKARKRFLEILPPLHILNTQDSDFTNSILDYFRDSHSVVKREATDADSGSMLTTALYDIIGAYMKVWVLPKAKLAFYTGTIPQDDVSRLWQYHDEIKRYLNTDGEGWHKPHHNYMSAMPANIELPALSSNKLVQPCDALMYVENTKDGFKIPIPRVSWLNGSESMFIPLKDNDVISLNSPNSSDTLLKYYDTAKNCIESSSVEDKLNYDNRFQDWLIKDVVPHLNDEKLYPPLKSVLALLNKPRHLYNRNKTHSANVTSLIHFTRFDFTTKMGIITGIIYLEIFWCVCALCCLGCTRFKKRKATKKVHLHIGPGRPKALHRTWTESTQCGTAINGLCDRYTETTRGTHQTSAEIQCPQRRSQDTTCAHSSCQHSVGTDSRRNIQTQLSPTHTTKPDNGPRLEQRSSTKVIAATQSLRNVTSRKILSAGVELDSVFCTSVTDETQEKSETDSVAHGLHHTNTVVMLNKIEPKEKEIEAVRYLDEIEMKAKSSPTDGCKQPKKAPLSILTNHEQRLCVEEAIDQILKDNDIHNNHKTNKDVNTRVRANRTPRKPYLEIIIDRPQIGSVCTVDMVEIKNIKAVKASGIPKRIFTNINTQTLTYADEKS